jgi:hypothetical protein
VIALPRVPNKPAMAFSLSNATAVKIKAVATINFFISNLILCKIFIPQDPLGEANLNTKP